MAEGSLPNKRSLEVRTSVPQSLSTDDVTEVLEEIREVQNKSRYIGLKLKLAHYIVEGIHQTYQQPIDRLYYVLLEFLKQVDPKPTWTAIVKALESPLVNSLSLARKIEKNYHCGPHPSTQGPITKHIKSEHGGSPDPVQSPVGPILVADDSEPMQTTSASSLQPSDTVMVTLFTSVNGIKAAISTFEDRFKALKRQTRQRLELLGPLASVRAVVERLTDLHADEQREHKVFLESNIRIMFRADDHLELFGTLNFYWNYLAYHLLDHLIREFAITEVKGDMEKYKIDLQQFRRATPLRLFCQAQRNKRLVPPAEFSVVAVEFEWRDDVTLDLVEEFRLHYCCFYNLYDCAMMLDYIGSGCFLVTWFIPQSIIGILKKITPEDILEKYTVIKLEIAGESVYENIENPSSSENQMEIVTVQEYDFVKNPSEDYVCPVTLGILLQPHQMACCGKHLSDEAVAIIKKERGACPMCKEPIFLSMLDKHFRREVHELCVFCHYKDLGCKWKGKLSDLNHHLESKLTVQCSPPTKGPSAIFRGSATTYQNIAYVTRPNSKSVYCSPENNQDKWKELMPCPYLNSGLVVIDGALTAVGGDDGSRYTNNVFTLRESEWAEKHPQMNIARFRPTIVSTTDPDSGHMNIFVIGGRNIGGWTNVVEVFNTGSRTWSQLASLPQYFAYPSAAIGRSELYVIGCDNEGCSCSLQALLSSERLFQSRSIYLENTWKLIPHLPVKFSTAATLCGQLVIVGGRQEDGSPVNSIHQLVGGQWVKIGSMSISRSMCLVVSPSPNKIVVVGGMDDSVEDNVEECVVSML